MDSLEGKPEQEAYDGILGKTLKLLSCAGCHASQETGQTVPCEAGRAALLQAPRYLIASMNADQSRSPERGHSLQHRVVQAAGRTCLQ